MSLHPSTSSAQAPARPSPPFHLLQYSVRSQRQCADSEAACMCHASSCCLPFVSRFHWSSGAVAPPQQPDCWSSAHHSSSLQKQEHVRQIRWPIVVVALAPRVHLGANKFGSLWTLHTLSHNAELGSAYAADCWLQYRRGNHDGGGEGDPPQNFGKPTDPQMSHPHGGGLLDTHTHTHRHTHARPTTTGKMP